MNKSLKNISMIVALIILLCVTLAGCADSSGQTEQSSVALVIGAHKFNPKFILSDKLKSMLDNVVSGYGNISVTIVSGEPVTVSDWAIKPVEEDVGKAKLKQIAQANLEVIVNKISQLRAQTPEVDTLSAIRQAANNLAQKDTAAKTLVIYDSGLSTAGYLDFTEPKLIMSDPEAVVGQLSEKSAIPDLTGIDVVWYGVGQVRGEQSRLSSNHSAKLKAMWDAVLRAGNPASLYFNDADLTEDFEQGDLPYVSTVAFPSDEIDLTAADPVDKIFLQLTDEKLSFQPDSSEFLDEQEAAAILDNVASVLNHSKTPGVYVVGSTATVGSHETSVSLSEKRADKVKDELISRGVGIAVRSAGIGDTVCSLRTDDIDSNGNLIEEQAKQNRAVFIISEDSDTVRSLIDEGVI